MKWSFKRNEYTRLGNVEKERTMLRNPTKLAKMDMIKNVIPQKFASKVGKERKAAQPVGDERT